MGAHHGHDMGHTVAGWTGTLIAVTGTTVTGLGMITGAGPVLWLGLALTALAAPATWALHLAGWGKPSGPRPVEQHHWRRRDPAARTGHPDCLGCRLAGRDPSRAPRRATAPVPASVNSLPSRPDALRQR
ncbi:HGxxPAAW family protein [Kitasatospora cinereorecta]|uniref:HGxxPAAW family protein n=1 Tax=Kitasatospora cinereorecta TaxID=285560 RepID=A0ABW0VA84_9ACTN